MTKKTVDTKKIFSDKKEENSEIEVNKKGYELIDLFTKITNEIGISSSLAVLCSTFTSVFAESYSTLSEKVGKEEAKKILNKYLAVVFKDLEEVFNN